MTRMETLDNNIYFPLGHEGGVWDQQSNVDSTTPARAGIQSLPTVYRACGRSVSFLTPAIVLNTHHESSVLYPAAVQLASLYSRTCRHYRFLPLYLRTLPSSLLDMIHPSMYTTRQRLSTHRQTYVFFFHTSYVTIADTCIGVVITHTPPHFNPPSPSHSLLPFPAHCLLLVPLSSPC